MWLSLFLIGIISFISEFTILGYKNLFVKSIRNEIKYIKDKNNLNEINKDLKMMIYKENDRNETERKLINQSENDYQINSRAPIIIKKRESNDNNFNNNILNLNNRNLSIYNKKK